MATSTNSLPVALVIGASRGIGRQIALDLAKNGYAVIVAAKTVSAPDSAAPFPPDPNSPDSTITTVAREITEAGGEATAIQVDVRSYESICSMVDQVITKYARLDVLVYNPGAIYWSSVFTTPHKRFQLMNSVNVSGLYGAVQACLPHIRKAASASASAPTTTAPPLGGRIIVISPPIYSRFFRGKTAYAMTKVSMSVLTVGLGMDIAREGVPNMAITSLWPAVAIRSAATEKFTKANPEELRDLRHAGIFGDAVVEILRAGAGEVNGRLLVDEDFLQERGWTEFGRYSVVPGAVPRRIMPVEFPDLRVVEQDDEGRRYDSASDGKGKAKL